MNIVIVDDQPSTRTILRHIVKDIGPRLDVHDFSDSQAALEWCDANPPDLLLLDYRMPVMDGLEMTRAFRRDARNQDVPIVMVSVVDDEPVRQAALDAGVIHFMVKPVRPRELHARCRNLLQLRQHAESVKQRVASLERQLVVSLHQVEERERETLSRLARAIQLRNADGANLGRMARIAAMIAEGLGLPGDQVHAIELAAPLLDIGKIAIADALLMNPGPLDDDECSRMQQHPRIGYELLQDSQNRFVQVAASIARHHHECHDGTGYPDGLAGENIPIEARIVAVADIFDALITPKPGKRALTIEEALAFVEAESGKKLDPDCVQGLLGNLPRLHEICAQYAPGASILGNRVRVGARQLRGPHKRCGHGTSA